MPTRAPTKLFPRIAAPRLFVRALLAAAPLAGACTDGYDASSPALNRARVPLRAVYAVTPSSAAAINRIRVTIDVDPSGPRFGPFTFNVDPNQSSWSLPVEFELSSPVNVMVLAELINVTNNTETVQYSGRIGPIRVRPGDRQQSAPPIPLYPGDPSNLDIKSIQLAPPPPLLEGASVQLRATVQGGGARPTIVWKSLTPGIATVDDSGLLSALLPGTARIEAYAGPKSATADIIVNRRVDRVVLTPGTITIPSLGASADFNAAVLDPRGQPFTGMTLLWTVADNAIAEVIGPGKFRAKAGGRTTVTAAVQSLPEVKGTAVLIVAQKIEKLAITPASGRIESLNGTFKFSGSARDANDVEISNPGFKWTSSSPGVATIDQNGVATALSEGRTTITLEAGGLSTNADLEVQQTVAAIVVNATSITLQKPGDTFALQAMAVDANNVEVQGAPILFTSADPKVASVTNGGLVTGVGPGQTEIVVSVRGLSVKVAVKVEGGDPRGEQ